MFDMPTHRTALPCPPCCCRHRGPVDQATDHPVPGPIPGSQLVWLPGLNHVPISDNPTAVARRMLTFLRQITPQALTAA